MGGGSSKNKLKPEPVKQPQPPRIEENITSIPALPTRSNLSPVDERNDFMNNSISLQRNSTPRKESFSNLQNGTGNKSFVLVDEGDHTGFDGGEDHTGFDGGEDHTHLPPINNSFGKSKSRSSSKASTYVAPIKLNNRSPTSASNTSSSHTHHNHDHDHDHDNSTTHRQSGRFCSHCPHCRQKNGVDDQSLPSTPQLKWVSKKPKEADLSINMDDYDIEAVQEKLAKKNGHLPGSYDYQTQLTIDSTNDYDSTKENYYTLPFVAKTVPRVSPTRTPFPEYNILQRKERRINKPYTTSLFAD